MDEPLALYNARRALHALADSLLDDDAFWLYETLKDLVALFDSLDTQEPK